MKHVKMLGLLAVAAAALMALAGSASATTINSNEGETPSVTATSTNSKLAGAFITVECSHSEAKGAIESHGSGVNASGNLSSLTFTGCNYTTTVKSAGSLSINSSNEVFSSGTELNVSTSVGTCVFTTSNTKISTLTESNETGGNAVLDINSAKIPRTGGNFLCGSSGTWTGSYTITSPSILNVDEGGGGEGGEVVRVNPWTYTWTSYFAKAFKIENIGPSSWVPEDIELSSVTYTLNDPNNCQNTSVSSGSSCTIYVTGSTSSSPASLTVRVYSGGKFKGIYISYLNI